jgi:hypothetical protein
MRALALSGDWCAASTFPGMLFLVLEACAGTRACLDG